MDERNISGFLILYLDVASLPPDKVKFFVDRMREELFGTLEATLYRQGYEVLVVPRRNVPTEIKVVSL